MSMKDRKRGYLTQVQAGSPYKNKNIQAQLTKTAPVSQEKSEGVNNG